MVDLSMRYNIFPIILSGLKYFLSKHPVSYNEIKKSLEKAESEKTEAESAEGSPEHRQLLHNAGRSYVRS